MFLFDFLSFDSPAIAAAGTTVPRKLNKLSLKNQHNKKMANTLSKNLTNLAHERGVKWQEVAAATGIAQSMISRWLAGTVAPRDASLQKIADYFEVPLSSLIQIPSDEFNASESISRDRELIAAQRKIIELMQRENDALREENNQLKARR